MDTSPPGPNASQSAEGVGSRDSEGPGRYVSLSYTCSLRLQISFYLQRLMILEAKAAKNSKRSYYHQRGHCVNEMYVKFLWYLMNHLRQEILML